MSGQLYFCERCASVRAYVGSQSHGLVFCIGCRSAWAYVGSPLPLLYLDTHRQALFRRFARSIDRQNAIAMADLGGEG